MNTADDYEKARALLAERYEMRLDALRQEQERTREERAWVAARNEQDNPRAPQPSGGPESRAPDLMLLVRAHEGRLRTQDERQRDALLQEHAGELQKLQEARRQGAGQGLTPEEIAVMALPQREQTGQREAPMRNLTDELNRQSLSGTVTDESRVKLEQAAEERRTARVMNQARGTYEANQAAALAKLRDRRSADDGNAPKGPTLDNEPER